MSSEILLCGIDQQWSTIEIIINVHIYVYVCRTDYTVLLRYKPNKNLRFVANITITKKMILFCFGVRFLKNVSRIMETIIS